MTLKKIAERAEVSISTVSLVLAGKGRVSDPVRKKVLSIAKALKYKSPLYTEQQSGSRLIGVLYHTDSRWNHVYHFIQPAIQAIEVAVRGHNFNQVLIPFSTTDSADSIFDKVKNINADGLCSVHYVNKELFGRLEKEAVPVVIINNSSFQDRFSTVCVDDFQGAYEGTKHLINLGHRDILFMDYERDTMEGMINDRYFGFQKAMTEAGVNILKKHRLTVRKVKTGEISRKVQRLFGKTEHPTAIFAHDDYLALHIITVLKESGLTVPDDVSIIAPGDVLDYTEPFIPGITTMQVDTAKLGELAGEMIVQRLENIETSPHTLKIKQKLCSRKSCCSLLSL